MGRHRFLIRQEAISLAQRAMGVYAWLLQGEGQEGALAFDAPQEAVTRRLWASGVDRVPHFKVANTGFAFPGDASDFSDLEPEADGPAASHPVGTSPGDPLARESGAPSSQDQRPLEERDESSTEPDGTVRKRKRKNGRRKEVVAATAERYVMMEPPEIV